MSHFLEKVRGAVTIANPHAAMSVKVKGKTLTVDPDNVITIAKAGTKWVKLPDGYKVVTSDGKEVPASNAFYISEFSIDPCHLIADFGKRVVFL